MVSVIIDLDRVSTWLASTHASAVTKSSDMLNKNTLGTKNCEANEKQQLNGYTCDQNV